MEAEDDDDNEEAEEVEKEPNPNESQRGGGGRRGVDDATLKNAHASTSITAFPIRER